MAQGVIALEDGKIYRGSGFGFEGITTGEIVFNTSMTGYQEILTDPSYFRQIVTLTVPHVGNTGVNRVDVESEKIWVSGLVVRSLSPIVSNWRHYSDLSSYLKVHQVVGVSEIPTRSLVRHIREKGVMRAVIAHGDDYADDEALIEMAQASPDMKGANLVDEVTSKAIYDWTEAIDAEWNSQKGVSAEGKLIVAYDFGLKQNILRLFRSRGFDVKVVPAQTSAAEVLALQPDGVFLSNGPGDPEAVDYAIENVRHLLGQVPIFGICLGHQILALALGGQTEKMRFGHRGGNQPIKNLKTGAIEICAHNHGFAVLKGSDLKGGKVTHLNINDQTIAGLAHLDLKAFSVQYHPEASPGPHDSFYLFDAFVESVLDHSKV